MHSLSDGTGQNSSAKVQFKRVPEGAFDGLPQKSVRDAIDTGLLATALGYAARGWRVLPLHDVDVTAGRCSCRDGAECSQAGKHPRTPKGSKDASTDPDTIRSWWGKWPAANIGIEAGAESGIWMLGPDGAQGLADLAGLEAENGPLPATYRNRSGSGGAHLVFRWPADGEPVTNRRNHRGCKIDVRGAGGYFVAPPSINSNGAYTNQAETEPAEAPAWLLAWVRGEKPAPPPPPNEGHAPRGQRPDVYKRASAYLAKVPGAVSGQGGHDQTFAAARSLVWGFGLSEDESLRLLQDEYNPRCSPPWSETELRHKTKEAATKDFGKPYGYLRDAERAPGRAASPGYRWASGAVAGTDAGDADADTRPVIVIGPDEYRVNSEATAALASCDGLYQYGGVLVHIPAQWETHAPPKIAVLPDALVRDRLTQCAAWSELTNDGNLKAAHPPAWAVAAVARRGFWPGVPALRAIVPYPVFTADGRLIRQPGYDSASGYFAAWREPLTANIPESPNREAAAAAAQVLRGLLRDFTFEDEADFSAWLAFALTLVCRPMIDGPTPLFLFNANRRGSGKTLLAKAATAVVTGGAMPTKVYPRGDTEMRKAVTTYALEGAPLVVFDNVTGHLGCGSLDAALTSTRWTDRVLGESKSFDGELRLVLAATVNNASLVGDTDRRVLPIRLYTDLQNPENRGGFQQQDLTGHILQNQNEYLTRLLSLPAAWIAAGMPHQELPNWGSYEAWGGVVRQMLVWAGCDDPIRTRAGLADMAVESDAVAGLFHAMRQMDPHGKGLTASQLVRSLEEEFLNAELKAELETAMADLIGGRPETHAVGCKLRTLKDACHNGYTLTRTDTRAHGGSPRWVVRPVPQVKPAASTVENAARPPFRFANDDREFSPWGGRL